MFKWLGSRIFWGSLLILAGVAFLLQNFGFFPFGDIFWGLFIGFLGAAFLSIYLRERENWWAIIPGIILLATGLLILVGLILPESNLDWGGFIFLAGIGIAFFVVYLVRRENWWAVIPGGVMTTLAVVSLLDNMDMSAGENGGIFFLGLGLTFVLVAILPTPHGTMGWAWIPAVVLFVIGLLLTASMENALGTIWPIFFILLGGFLLVRALVFRNR